MKKLYFFSALSFMLFTLPSVAQINKGSVLLGGDMNFSVQKTTGSFQTGKQSTFTFSPSFARAIKTNTFLGGFVSASFYNGTNSSSPAFIKSKGDGYGAGIFLRKYYPLGKSMFSLFAQGTLGYSYNYQSGNNGPNNAMSVITNSVSLNCNPGISYKISRRLQIETGLSNLLSLGYSNQKNNFYGFTVVQSKTNSFSLSSNISGIQDLYAGFRLLINK